LLNGEEDSHGFGWSAALAVPMGGGDEAVGVGGGTVPIVASWTP
jgi:hypothetical protein